MSRLAESGQCDGRHRSQFLRLADPLDELEAILFRQPKVGNDHIGMAKSGDLYASPGVRSHIDGVSQPLQFQLQDIQNIGRVFNQQ